MPEFSPKDGTPLGRLYSSLYLERGKPTDDDPRMRFRLAAIIRTYRALTINDTLDRIAEQKLGIPSPYSSGKGWKPLLAQWNLVHVLDLITIAAKCFDDGRAEWVAAVNEIFSDLNLSWRVDKHGGVHPYPDEDFARSKTSTIAALQSSKYSHVASQFVAGTAAIGRDNKTAIWQTFCAAESLFRLMFARAPQLSSSQADQLLPLLQKKFAGNAAALGASTKLLASFKDWIEACHFYRHGQGQEEATQPPPTLAVHLVSTGASFIRLLAELDSPPL